jgi:hypothetical protein
MKKKTQTVWKYRHIPAGSPGTRAGSVTRAACSAEKKLWTGSMAYLIDQAGEQPRLSAAERPMQDVPTGVDHVQLEEEHVYAGPPRAVEERQRSLPYA